MRPHYDYNIDRLREFIARCEWKWASTMVDIPHQYIYRGRCNLSNDEYYEFLYDQTHYGTLEYYGGRMKPYLYIDGFKYWTMGDYIPENNTMNRQRVYTEFSQFGSVPPKYYSDRSAKIVSLALKQFDYNELLDVGCGTGELLEYTNLSPEKYYGIEPVGSFMRMLKSRKGFARRGITKTFEECVTSKLKGKGQLIVMTFGTASLVMPPYFKFVKECGSDYFLMFFDEGWMPDELKGMHDFGYTRKQIMQMFPYDYKCRLGNYLLVSSKVIDWNKCNPDEPTDSLF